jgi:hypothetical protein
MQKHFLVTAILCAVTSPALAVYPVTVDSSIPITTQVVPQLSAANATLGGILSINTSIGGAVTEGTDKIAAMIQESATNQQQYSSYAQEAQNLEHARQSFTVPDSICSESASGQAAQVTGTAVSAQSSLSAGHGVSDSAISKILSDPAPAPEQDLFRSATVHARYCTASEEQAYGDGICSGTSDLPGGDTDIQSVLYGAGPEGKTPDLTFSQDQNDAAMMYLKNTTRLDVSKQLSKGEVKSESGKQYVGMMAQYQAMQSAAQQPELELIAGSKPNAATKEALAETLTSSSAKTYYDATASSEAKRTGEMSQREYETFEVGRRYANTDYLTDLQAMQGDNLTRESIRVQNLQNWLLLGIRQQLQEQAVINGQQLALESARYYGPRLQKQLQQVNAGAVR